MCRSRRELSNEYLLAKIFSFFFERDRSTLLACLLACVDTAENEPLEIRGKIIQYYSFVSVISTVSRTRCIKAKEKNVLLLRAKDRGPQRRERKPHQISPSARLERTAFIQLAKAHTITCAYSISTALQAARHLSSFFFLPGAQPSLSTLSFSS